MYVSNKIYILKGAIQYSKSQVKYPKVDDLHLYMMFLSVILLFSIFSVKNGLFQSNMFCNLYDAISIQSINFRLLLTKFDDWKYVRISNLKSSGLHE